MDENLLKANKIESSQSFVSQQKYINSILSYDDCVNTWVNAPSKESIQEVVEEAFAEANPTEDITAFKKSLLKRMKAACGEVLPSTPDNLFEKADTEILDTTAETEQLGTLSTSTNQVIREILTPGNMSKSSEALKTDLVTGLFNYIQQKRTEAEGQLEEAISAGKLKEIMEHLRYKLNITKEENKYTYQMYKERSEDYKNLTKDLNERQMEVFLLNQEIPEVKTQLKEFEVLYNSKRDEHDQFVSTFNHMRSYIKELQLQYNKMNDASCQIIASQRSTENELEKCITQLEDKALEIEKLRKEAASLKSQVASMSEERSHIHRSRISDKNDLERKEAQLDRYREENLSLLRRNNYIKDKLKVNLQEVEQGDFERQVAQVLKIFKEFKDTIKQLEDAKSQNQQLLDSSSLTGIQLQEWIKKHEDEAASKETLVKRIVELGAENRNLQQQCDKVKCLLQKTIADKAKDLAVEQTRAKTLENELESTNNPHSLPNTELHQRMQQVHITADRAEIEKERTHRELQGFLSGHISKIIDLQKDKDSLDHRLKSEQEEKNKHREDNERLVKELQRITDKHDALKAQHLQMVKISLSSTNDLSPNLNTKTQQVRDESHNETEMDSSDCRESNIQKLQYQTKLSVLNQETIENNILFPPREDSERHLMENLQQNHEKIPTLNASQAKANFDELNKENQKHKASLKQYRRIIREGDFLCQLLEGAMKQILDTEEQDRPVKSQTYVKMNQLLVAIRDLDDRCGCIKRVIILMDQL